MDNLILLSLFLHNDIKRNRDESGRQQKSKMAEAISIWLNRPFLLNTDYVGDQLWVNFRLNSENGHFLLLFLGLIQ